MAVSSAVTATDDVEQDVVVERRHQDGVPEKKPESSGMPASAAAPTTNVR